MGYLANITLPHLHLEIRNAPGNHDPYSNWQRDNAAHHLRVSIDSVTTSNPLNPQVSLTVNIANNQELDFNRVEIAVFQKQADGTLIAVAQPGDIAVLNTPESTGYYVTSPWFDAMLFNRQYSYKNSQSIPWADFEQGGRYQSPYANDAGFPNQYNPNYHLDNSLVGDNHSGQFNGVIISPAPFSVRSNSYQMRFRFTQLVGVSDPTQLCIQARALDIHHAASPWQTYNCSNNASRTTARPVDSLTPFGWFLLLGMLGCVGYIYGGAKRQKSQC